MRVVALLFALGILACAGMTWSAGLPVPILDARAIEQRCEKALAGGRAEIARMEKRRTGDVLAEWNRLKIGVEDIA